MDDQQQQSTWVHSLTVARLRDELKARGLSQGGLKAALSARLLAAVHEASVYFIALIPILGNAGEVLGGSFRNSCQMHGVLSS